VADRRENGRPRTFEEAIMTISKRIVLLTLIVALTIAMVPLWGRTAVLPCRFMHLYMLTYRPPTGHGILPDYGFPHFPPHCRDLLRGQGYML
jgi:hypothetical protein